MEIHWNTGGEAATPLRFDETFQAGMFRESPSLVSPSCRLVLRSPSGAILEYHVYGGNGRYT